MTNSVNGVFAPQNATESVKFQKLAIALGYAWKRAGAKVIGTKDSAIKLKDGVMSPVSNYDSDNTVTIVDLQAAVDASREGQTLVTRAQLLKVWNITKCREIEEVLRGLLQENFDKDEDEQFPVPQDIVDRAVEELDDQQREYFADAGIVIAVPHVNSKYSVNQVLGQDLPVDLTTVELTEVGVSPKLGTILMDADGNVYFATVK